MGAYYGRIIITRGLKGLIEILEKVGEICSKITTKSSERHQ